LSCLKHQKIALTIVPVVELVAVNVIPNLCSPHPIPYPV
jgi:hypothetical protein